MTDTMTKVYLKSKVSGNTYMPYAGTNIAPATSSTLGGIIVGGGLDSDTDGTVSLDTDYLGSVFPDFDLLEPVATYTYNISATGFKQIWSRDNTNLSTTNALVEELNDIAWYRITVSSGTTIKSVTDFVCEFPGGSNASPVLWWKDRSYANTLSASGLYQSAVSYPTTLSSGSVYEHACSQYNGTERTWKVEVFRLNGDITFNSSVTSTVYNSSNHERSISTIHNTNGYGYQGTTFNANVESANSAGHVTGYLSKYLGSAPIAGETISANTLSYLSTADNKLYSIATTNKAINASFGLGFNKGSTTSGNTASVDNVLKQGVWDSLGSISHDTFTQGAPVYLRCTMSNGAIYSDNYLATSMSAGYTWAKVGVAFSATAIAIMLEDSVFFTLNSSGALTHVNGISIPGASVATTSAVGLVQPDNSTITITNAGIISAVQPNIIASASWDSAST